VIEPPHHRSPSTANRMTATESLFFGRLNEFYNKICQKRTLSIDKAKAA
jgi:hypothetical protein